MGLASGPELEQLHARAQQLFAAFRVADVHRLSSVA
jgi:hypothetical protein